MKHLGDITKINGAEIPIVDCITGGSPCQDLSVAGKRAGLSGERSGLFMEQLRIVKEMRKRDQEENGRTNQFIRPRFMVWENVPGAFSSNNGKDFQAVLTEIVRIVEPDAPDVPMPDKGKWTKSGCIYDEMGRWSIAWRVHDAQFWGVPQRRKRIALVADFGGLAAPEVQFERKGVSRDTEPGRETRKGTAGDTQESVDRTEQGFNIGSYHSNSWKSSNPNSGVYATEQSKTLDALNCGKPDCNQGGTAIVRTFPIEGNGQSESHRGDGYSESNQSYTLNSTEQHAVFADTYNQTVTGDVSATLSANSCATATRSGPSVLEHNRGGVSDLTTSCCPAEQPTRAEDTMRT